MEQYRLKQILEKLITEIESDNDFAINCIIEKITLELRANNLL